MLRFGVKYGFISANLGQRDSADSKAIAGIILHPRPLKIFVVVESASVQWHLMPELSWDETDFLGCLKVVPVVGEYETMHSYEVSRSGLSLLLKVRQFESTVSFALRQHEIDVPLLEFVLFVRGEARYVNDKRGTYLEFRDALLLPCRFAFGILGDLSDTTKFAHSWTVQLQVKPHIHIRYDVS